MKAYNDISNLRKERDKYDRKSGSCIRLRRARESDMIECISRWMEHFEFKKFKSKFVREQFFKLSNQYKRNFLTPYI